MLVDRSRPNSNLTLSRGRCEHAIDLTSRRTRQRQSSLVRRSRVEENSLVELVMSGEDWQCNSGGYSSAASSSIPTL